MNLKHRLRKVHTGKPTMILFAVFFFMGIVCAVAGVILDPDTGMFAAGLIIAAAVFVCTSGASLLVHVGVFSFIVRTVIFKKKRQWYDEERFRAQFDGELSPEQMREVSEYLQSRKFYVENQVHDDDFEDECDANKECDDAEYESDGNEVCDENEEHGGEQQGADNTNFIPNAIRCYRPVNAAIEYHLSLKNRKNRILLQAYVIYQGCEEGLYGGKAPLLKNPFRKTIAGLLDYIDAPQDITV